MLNVFAVEGITMVVIEIVLLAVKIYAFVSSLRYSDEAYRAAGKLNKQIATELSISERSVKAHRAQVMEKMQATSLAELVHIADNLHADTPSA